MKYFLLFSLVLALGCSKASNPSAIVAPPPDTPKTVDEQAAAIKGRWSFHATGHRKCIKWPNTYDSTAADQTFAVEFEPQSLNTKAAWSVDGNVVQANLFIDGDSGYDWNCTYAESNGSAYSERWFYGRFTSGTTMTAVYMIVSSPMPGINHADEWYGTATKQ